MDFLNYNNPFKNTFFYSRLLEFQLRKETRFLLKKFLKKLNKSRVFWGFAHIY